MVCEDGERLQKAGQQACKKFLEYWKGEFVRINWDQLLSKAKRTDCPAIDPEEYANLTDLERALQLKKHANCESHAKVILAPSGKFNETAYSENEEGYIHFLRKQMALGTHPDKNPGIANAANAFYAITEAAEVLSPKNSTIASFFESLCESP